MTNFLTKQQASNYLTNTLGLPISEKTLSKLITTGGSPEYRKFGRRVVYGVDALKTWAENRLSQPITSSTQGGVK